MSIVDCNYCSRPAMFRKHGDIGYPYRRDYGPVFACQPCGAWVGTHPNGLPLGRLANAELRDMKIKAHAAFDPLWKDWMTAYPDLKQPNGKIRRIMRNRAYAWLAEHMGINGDLCHIGMFDVHTCQLAIDTIKAHNVTAADIRSWAKDKAGDGL